MDLDPELSLNYLANKCRAYEDKITQLELTLLTQNKKLEEYEKQQEVKEDGSDAVQSDKLVE